LRGRELTITYFFGSWERLYDVLSSLLAIIQNFTNDIKYLIVMVPSIKFSVEIFNCVAWSFDSYIAARPNLWPVLTIDAILLLGWYFDKLFMTCTYDTKQ
jgi:hypothetical protein